MLGDEREAGGQKTAISLCAREKKKSYFRLRKIQKTLRGVCVEREVGGRTGESGAKAGKEKASWVFPHLHCPLTVRNTETFHFKG